MAAKSRPDREGIVKGELPPFDPLHVCPKCGCVLVKTKFEGPVARRTCEEVTCKHRWDEALPPEGGRQ